MQLIMMLLVLSLCLFPNLATAASPHIYDVPQAGPPGSQTTTVGNGWDPNATLDIYFDSTDVGLVDTDSNGSFGMALKAPTIRQNGLTIQIPADAVPGQHWITAVERITELQAQVSFTVRTDWAQFHFDAQHTGFNPYENVLSPQTVGNLTTRWQYTIGITPSSSPTVVNGVVYVGGRGSTEQDLYAFDAGTGALLWKFPALVNDSGGPAVVNGVVYFGGDYLYALHADSGTLLWSYPGGWVSSPAVVNGVVYIGSSDNNVYALDASTGVQLWKYTTGGPVWSTPAVANGVVYAGCDDGSLYALDAGTGSLLWRFATLSEGNTQDAPVVANGIVYITSGDIYALNANAGALIWEAGGYCGVKGTPAVANGVVFVGGYTCPPNHQYGYVYAFDAGTGFSLWSYPTLGDVFPSPAVANGVVYGGAVGDWQGDHSAVYAINASTGTGLWAYTTDGPFYSSPAVVNGMLYIASWNQTFYAFGLPDQQMSEKFSPPERPDPARLTPDRLLQPDSAATLPPKR